MRSCVLVHLGSVSDVSAPRQGENEMNNSEREREREREREKYKEFDN